MDLWQVAADLAGEPRRLYGRRVLREPALEGGSEFEDREKDRDEDGDHERRLERREAPRIASRPSHRTACIWETSAVSRATRPLFQADTPMTRVPRTTAAPMMYSIVARPSDRETNRRSTRMRQLPRADAGKLSAKRVPCDGQIGRYRSTDRGDQRRRPSALFAARASFTPTPSVVLFF